MSHKGMLSHTFEYDGYNGDPGHIELRIHYNFTPGTPEAGRGYLADPALYDPGSGHEVEYLYAQREVEIDGKKTFQRLKTMEWLDEWCRSFLASRDADDLMEGIPSGPDPDDARDAEIDRRLTEKES